MVDVILYYHFHPISNVERLCKEHKQKCLSLNLLGRIYLAREGINGTLAGARESIAVYKEYLTSLPGFGQTAFKEDWSDFLPFRKLIVKCRPELVTLKAKEAIDVSSECGERLSPREWKKALESGQDHVVLDARNTYEWKVGHFDGAVLPEVENFYDFPQWFEAAGIDPAKKVLMYCTGGIRCEKLSALMLKKGYKRVYQLQGGIINYAQKEGGAHFRGKCFVFDDRLTVPVNKDDRTPIARCAITGKPCDTYINCANPDCNRLFICSEEGARRMQGCCNTDCMSSARRRPLDSDNIFAPTRKWYEYFEHKI